MNQEVSLKKIERKIYLKYLDDGLLELFYGFVIFLFGIGMVTDTAWIGGVFGSLTISIWIPLKKKITEPRMGQVIFNSQRKKGIKIQHLAFIGLGLLSFISAVGVYLLYTGEHLTKPEFFNTLPLLPLGVLFSLPAFLMGAWNKISRFLFYGVVLLLIFIAGGLLKIEPSYYVMASGIIILLAGSLSLIGFIRQNPLPPEEN